AQHPGSARFRALDETLAQVSSQSSAVSQKLTADTDTRPLPRVAGRAIDIFWRMDAVVSGPVGTVDPAAKVMVVGANTRVVPRNVPPGLLRGLRFLIRGKCPQVNRGRLITVIRLRQAEVLVTRRSRRDGLVVSSRAVGIRSRPIHRVPHVNPAE